VQEYFNKNLLETREKAPMQMTMQAATTLRLQGKYSARGI